jgi:ATP-dependent helicase/nuclease subunit B
MEQTLGGGTLQEAVEAIRPDSDLRSALEHVIRGLRSGNLLLRVAVVVPNRLLGTWLSRSIFADTGHMAIDFELSDELAARVAQPRLLGEGRARAPENVALALLLGAIPEAIGDADTPEYLRAAARTAGFGPIALRTIESLAAAGLRPEALEANAPTAADPERLRLLARLWRGYEAGLEKAHLLDRPHLFAAASQALPAPQLGAVVLCGVDDSSPAEAAFFKALGQHHPLAIVGASLSAERAPRHAARQKALVETLGAVLEEPTVQAATSLGRLQSSLFALPAARADGDKARLDTSLQVLSAAGEALEAVEIARLIQQAAQEGVRYQEIAVLLRSPDSYSVGLASALERAGIDAFFVDGVPRIDPAARSLSLMLDLIGADLDRGRVMELLTSARIKWGSVLGADAEVSPSGWDRLSARAGIVSGLEAWRKRLARAREDREAHEYDDDRDLRRYDSLLRVIERLAADLATLPEKGSWAAYLDATLALLDTWIERPELTRDRLERVLRPLAQYAPPPSREEFLKRTRELLATQFYQEGKFGEGRVFVGSIRAARGLRFRRVFVPGLVERAFPAIVRPDPLLLDDEREALSPHLRTTRDGQEAERLLFLDAVSAAEERLVLSYPRFDSASGRERVPSSFLLHALEAALGRRIGAADLARLATPGLTALGRPHPEDPALALDRTERDLALVASGTPAAARHLAAPDSFLVRSLAQERASWDTNLTPWDGIVDVTGAPEHLARLRLAGQKSSASTAQAFAECPYRHLLRYGLNLHPWEEPERAYQIEGKDFGTLYHAVAHRLFAELAEQGRLPLRDGDPERLADRVRELVDEELESFASEGGIMNAALLGPVRVRLRSDLEEMLRDQLDEAPDGPAFVPVGFEREFEALEVAIGNGASVSFRGKIDRLDLSAETGQVRVIDYKTGKHFWKNGEQWKGGRELQLAVYNRAAKALFPDRDVAEAVYYYATATGEYRRKSCAATPEADATLTTVLSTLDDLATAGVFPPVADTCTFCDFQTVCGPFKENRAARKSGDPRLAEFKRLRDIR